MKKKVLMIVLPIIILLFGAMATICVVLFQSKNPYKLKAESFEEYVEFNGEVDLTTLSIYDKKSKKTIYFEDFNVISCDLTNSVGEKVLVIEYNNRQFKIPFYVKYKIDFCLDGEIISSQFVSEIDEIIVPENVVKDGYEFISWDKAMPEILDNNLTFNAIISSTTLSVPKLQTVSTEYGTKLSSIVLPSNQNGKWVFTGDISNEVGNVGKNTFEVKFVPNTTELVEKYSSVDIDVYQKELTFTIFQDEFTYDGNEHFPVYSLPVDGLNVIESESKINANKESYNYSIFINEENYSGYYIGTFKINKADVNIAFDTELENNCVEYNQEFDLKYTITGFENEEILDLIFDNHLNLNAGTHYIGAISNNPNINLIVEKAVIEVLPISLDPTPSNPTLSSMEIPAVYGDKLSTITFNNFANGRWEWEDPNIIIDKINGFKSIAKFIPNSSNYKVETREIAIENILKKTLSIEIEENTYTYNCEPRTIVYNIENGEYNHLTVVGNVERTNAGIYATTLSIESEFYQGSLDTSLIINKATPATNFTTSYTKTWFTSIKLSNIELNPGYTWKSPSTSINVGTQSYSAIFTPEDTDNYNIVEGTFEVVVNKAEAQINNVKESYNFVYTGNPHAISGVQPVHNEENLKYSYSINGSKIESLTNAGIYNVTITLPESDHYYQTQVTTIVVIEKADLNVQLASLTATYEDSLSDVKLPQVGNGVWNWKESVSTLVGDVGEQKHIAVFSPKNENYNTAEFETTILVSRKNLAIEITQNKYTYDGTSHKLIYAIKDDKQTDYNYLEISGNDEKINANIYDITLSVKNPNYNATKTTQLIIEKASPIPEIPENLTATYLDLVQDIILPTAENGNWKWNTIESTTVGDAGTNSFSATFVFNEEQGCDNYFDYTTNLSIIVDKKSVSAPTLAEDEAFYTGSTIYAELKGNDSQLYRVTENGWVDVSDYNVKITLNNAQNYKWETSDLETLLLPFSIKKAQAVITGLSIKGWEYNKYDEKVNTPIAYTNFGKIAYSYSNEENGTYTSDVPTDAGNYFVKATIEDNDNYLGTSCVEVFNITKAFLSEPTIYSKPYTGDRIFADIDPSPLYSIVNEGGIEQGSYDVILTITNPNYQWGNKTSVLELEFIITSVVNKWSSDPTMPNWTYGETPIIKPITATYSDVSVEYKLADQDVSEYSSMLPTDAGYYVARYYASGSGSYNELLKLVYFTIDKYGVDIPTFSKDYTGSEITAVFEESDIYYIDEEKSTLKATNVSENVVTFVMTNPNYKWSIGDENIAKAIFKVAKATTIISDFKIDDWYYGEDANTPTANPSFGTIEYTYSTEKDGEYSTVVPTEAGTYFVKAEVVGTSNYSSAIEYETFEIKTSTTIISGLEIDDWYYSEEEGTPTADTNFGTITYKYSNKIDGPYTPTLPTEAGTYYIKAEVKSNSKNFTDAESEPYEFVIMKLPIDIPIIPSQIYNGSELTAEIPTSEIYSLNAEKSTIKATDASENVVIFEIVDENYEWKTGDKTTATALFKINKASTSISDLSIQNWIYGDAVSTPTAKAKLEENEYKGEIVYKYSLRQNEGFTTTVPTNVGQYYVKAFVIDTSNYDGSSSSALPFEILKASASISKLSMSDWTYRKDLEPDYEMTRSSYVDNEDVVVEYLVNEAWITEKPITPGTYKIRAKISGCENYDGCDYFDGNEFVVSAPELVIVNPVHKKVYLNVDDISSIESQDSAPKTIIKDTDIEIEGTWSYGEVNYLHGNNMSLYTLTFTPTDTNLLKQEGYTSTVYLTVASVAKIGTTFYSTIERALELAVSGDEIIVIAQTTNKVKIFSDTAVIKKGVTLVLPYDENDGRNKDGISNNDFSSDSMKKANEDSLPYLSLKNKVIMTPGSKLTIKEGGVLEIAGELSGANGGAAFAGHTARYYAELVMEAGAEIYSEGEIKLTGFITESSYNNGSIITADKGSVSLPFVLKDFRGGTYMAATYVWGKQNQTAPFNQYQFRNISSKLKVSYNAKVYGYANLYAKESRNHTTISFVGSGSDFMIMFTNENSYMLAHYNPSEEVCKLDFYNGFTLNALRMNIGGTSVSTSDVYFPINCYFNVSLNADENKTANYTLTQKIKLLPGAVLTIGKDVTATFGNVNVYDKTYIDETNVGRKYPTLNIDAIINVEGTMICESLGGNIKSQTIGASVQIKTNYSLTTYETIGEAKNYIFYQTVDFKAVPFTATFNGVKATTKGTYTYNGSSWTVS